jgi:hypothetical protein
MYVTFLLFQRCNQKMFKSSPNLIGTFHPVKQSARFHSLKQVSSVLETDHNKFLHGVIRPLPTSIFEHADGKCSTCR